MFSENLKTLRKQKGFSQEELATRLHVVRQTISKWEKNLSVPDADTLIRLAEILEVSVSELLGTKIENENVASDVAEQLSRINEQLAIKNRRSRRIWKIVAIILAVIVLVNIFIALTPCKSPACSVPAIMNRPIPKISQNISRKNRYLGVSSFLSREWYC